MKRCARLCCTLFGLLLSAASLEARINVFQTWRSGQDSKIAPVETFAGDGSLIVAERLADIPIQLTYVPIARLEAGAQWGIRHAGGFTGIRDLALGAKYQFLQGSESNPWVIGEAAVTLPTADSRHNLGPGAVAFLFHWTLEKQIEEVTGYLGLGAQLNSENSDHVQEGNLFFYHAGAGYDYRKDLRLYGELKGYNHGKTKMSGTEVEGSNIQELYLAPGADISVTALNRAWDLNAALLIGLTPESKGIAVSFSTAF